MSKRDIELFLRDMLTSVQKIQRYIGKKSYDEFINDDLFVDGVIRNLEVIGEDAKKIPSHFRKKYLEIEWKKIGGLRDMLIHEYFGMDYEILWDIVKNKIPVLNGQLEAIIKN